MLDPTLIQTLREELDLLNVEYHEFVDPESEMGVIVCKNTAVIRRQLSHPPPSSQIPPRRRLPSQLPPSSALHDEDNITSHPVTPAPDQVDNAIREAVAIKAALRGPPGAAWDAAQAKLTQSTSNRNKKAEAARKRKEAEAEGVRKRRQDHPPSSEKKRPRQTLKERDVDQEEDQAMVDSDDESVEVEDDQAMVDSDDERVEVEDGEKEDQVIVDSDDERTEEEDVEERAEEQDADDEGVEEEDEGGAEVEEAEEEDQATVDADDEGVEEEDKEGAEVEEAEEEDQATVDGDDTRVEEEVEEDEGGAEGQATVDADDQRADDIEEQETGGVALNQEATEVEELELMQPMSHPSPREVHAWFASQASGLSKALSPNEEMTFYRRAMAIAGPESAAEWQGFMQSWRDNGRLSSGPSFLPDPKNASSLPGGVREFRQAYRHVVQLEREEGFTRIAHRIRMVELRRLYDNVQVEEQILTQGKTRISERKSYLFALLYPQHATSPASTKLARDGGEGKVHRSNPDPRATFTRLLMDADRWDAVRRDLGYGVLGLIPTSIVPNKWVQRLSKPQYRLWVATIQRFNPNSVRAGHSWSRTLTKAIKGLRPSARPKLLESIPRHNLADLLNPSDLFTPPDSDIEPDPEPTSSQIAGAMPVIITNLQNIQARIEPLSVPLSSGLLDFVHAGQFPTDVWDMNMGWAGGEEEFWAAGGDEESWAAVDFAFDEVA